MTNFQIRLFSTICVSIWIAISSFLRDEVILKNAWYEFFQSNNLLLSEREYLWVLWAIMYAILIRFLSRKFSFWKTTLITWTISISLTLILKADMHGIPLYILIESLPLSFIESIVAVYIYKLFDKRIISN